MTPDELAALVSAADEPVSADLIRRHIRAGAPADAKGRLSLAAWAAWMIGQLIRE